jgi:hypothetical protein
VNGHSTTPQSQKHTKCNNSASFRKHNKRSGSACPIGVYTGSAGFLQGARDQVSYVYKKLGGDILDIEITEGNVYAAYEESVLEYSYIVNIHQSKNVLSDALGDATGSFNSDGELISSGSYNQHSGLSASLEGDRVELKYPNFQFSYARRVGQALSNEVNVGGFDTVYSAFNAYCLDTRL